MDKMGYMGLIKQGVYLSVFWKMAPRGSVRQFYGQFTSGESLVFLVTSGRASGLNFQDIHIVLNIIC